MKSLTERQIKNILLLRERGSTYSELARMFGVSKTTISNIINTHTEKEKKDEHEQFN